jgi:hypothetical protein
MTFDETLHDAFESLSDRLRAELRTAADQLTGTLQIVRGRDVGASSALVPSPAPPPGPAIDRLPDAVRAIGAARSLTEILDTLTQCAAGDAVRAALLIRRGGRLRGWRLAGFEPDAGAPATIDIDEAEAGLLADAIGGGTAVSSASAASMDAAPAFARLPPGHEGPRAALPIAIGGQVVAILYVDQGRTTDTSHSELIERELNVGSLEILTSYAARCLEAQTAFKAARWLLGRSDAAAVRPALPPTTSPTPDAPPMEAPDTTDANDPSALARRYARLLVSEIKLYHEPAVLAGRRERDLATRLGAEIARARVLYDQRVPPPLRQRTDYFHAELVRTLADGDSILMAAPQMTS